MDATLPDFLRLLFVPALAWAAWRDVRTRRVPNDVWMPFAALGLALLAWEAWARLPLTTYGDRLFVLRVGLSLGVVVPLSYLFWRTGGFGGADAKAFMTVAVLLPTVPTYRLPWGTYPLEPTALGVFSMTVLTNAVVVAMAYPLALAVRNALAGETGVLMFLGRRVSVSALPRVHGRLFETTVGTTRRGLDIDALRMYLRWRGATLADVRADPEHLRDPESVEETFDPGDGAVGDGSRPEGAGDDLPTDGGRASPETEADGERSDPDPWAAERFLADVDGDAYGTTPEKLREGLEVVTERDSVWVSPGVPFLVPTFVGLAVALTYGDLVFGTMRALGVV